MKKQLILVALAGFAAGSVNSVLGAGGGMLLIPLLTLSGCLQEKELFPSSVAVILPICVVTLLLSAQWSVWKLPVTTACLLGSAIGGVAAGLWGNKIPVTWLHRFFGALVLWGGIRFLC